MATSLLDEYYRLEKLHFQGTCETIVLDREYSSIMYTHKKNPSYETNVARREAQAKWAEKVKHNMAVWADLCSTKHMLMTDFGVIL